MLLALYQTKKDLKASVGKRLRYRETSLYGAEYRSDGWITVAHRPLIDGAGGREFFARVLMADDLIQKVT